MMNKVRYSIIIISLLVIIAQFFMIDYSESFKWKTLMPFLPSVLIIISMYFSIKHVNKHREN